MKASLFKIAMPLVALSLVCFWASGQQARTPSAQPTWEYRLLRWSSEDTLIALRAATGEELSSADSLVQELAERTDPPRDDPRLRVAIEERLSQRLVKAGKAGWEISWIREGSHVVGGHSLEAPSVFLKRQQR